MESTGSSDHMAPSELVTLPSNRCIIYDSDHDEVDARFVSHAPFWKWEVREKIFSPEEYFHTLFKKDGSTKNFTSLVELLPHVSRPDLVHLCRLMRNHYSKTPFQFGGRSVYYDLSQLCQELDDQQMTLFWQDQDFWIVKKWTVFERSTVNVVEIEDGRTIYMFTGREYPAKPSLLEQMLIKKLHAPPPNPQNQNFASSVIWSVQADLLHKMTPDV